MIVGIMRHAKAEPKSPGIPDEERRLTDEGRKQVAVVAEILPWRPSKIIHSPYIRARETAELLAAKLGVSQVEASLLLAPNSFNPDAFKRLASDGVLMVGHSPSVEEVLTSILGCRVKMKTASVAILEVEGDRATLLALLAPPTSSIP